MQRFLIFFVFCIFSFTVVKSAVNMKCASVSVNGAVTLNWNNTSGPGGFHAYYIYHATAVGGPYTLIDSVLIYANQFYTDNLANANNTGAAYYVELISTSGSVVIGDTIRAIRLSVANPNDGYAHLTWNTTDNPLIPTNGLYYYIYREFPSGVWTLIDSVTAQGGILTYNDEITICLDSIHYRVEVFDASGCSSVSDIHGDLFQDRISPSIPILDSVSVDPVTGLVTIGWEPDNSPDTYSYVIFHVSGGSSTSIDTVVGINNTFYTTTYDGTIGSESFILQAIDSCGNPSATCPVQHSIFMTASLDVCASSINLSWNAYINWPAGVKYHIYVSQNGGPFSILDSTLSTSYAHTTLSQNTPYCYFIRAIDRGNNTRTSSSNQVCITSHIITQPNFLYIRSASVTGPGQVTVKIYTDTAAQVIRYNILRSPDGISYTFIGFVMADTFNASLDYPDNTAEPDSQSYYYKAVAVDSCNRESFFSENIAHTIFLTGEARDDFTNSMTWSDYESWLGDVDHYKIYKNINGVTLGSSINLNPGFNFFTDEISARISVNPEFCYYAVAYEGQGNTYGFRDTSRSNEVCISQQPVIFIPNAFLPEHPSVNNIFKPSVSFVDVSTYSLDIFNRWGERVFHSSNPALGWDGLTGGKNAPASVYVYLLKVTGADGTEIERKGSVTLLR